MMRRDQTQPRPGMRLRAASRRMTAASLLLFGAMTSMAASAEIELPAIGDPVNQVLSPRQEARIGEAMMARARRHLDLNADPEIAAYINEVGQQLATHVEGGPPGGFHFFLVHDPRINAFAAPGGYIGIHSGLVLVAKNEAQLAAVLAHEIAHVTQRHIARAYAEARQHSYATWAAVLAALILGGENPEAAEAAIATGIATEQQRRINYTRSNEYEADRIGIRLLAEAGYDPDAMAGMFGLLQRTAGTSAGAPEFLRTHPLTSQRIAEARARAASMKKADVHQDSLAFHLMRTRLRVLEAHDPRGLHDRWRGTSAPEGTHAGAARAYGLALLALRLGRPEQAIDRLRDLDAHAPDNIHYGLALARAHRAAGQPEQALDRWRQVAALYPESHAVVATGAELYMATDHPAVALDLLTDFIRDVNAPPPASWRQLAHAADAAGRPVRSHEALAEFYSATGRYDRAVSQLRLALEQAPERSSDALRLKARLEQAKIAQRDRMAAP